LKLKSAQSDYYGGQINFVRRIAYWYGDTYTRDQGVKTCNAPISMDNYGQWWIFLHAISTNQHRWSWSL